MRQRAAHRCLSAALLPLCALTLGAQGRDSASTPRAALVVSGGVSLGSYQAGAAWAFIYALRNHDVLERARRDDPTLSRMATSPTYRLDVLSGASAGNINAIFAAVEYCARDAPRDPEASLFWRPWSDLGYSELTRGPVIEPELAAFSRTAFSPVWRMLDSAMRTQRSLPDCDLLLGITTTKLTPHLVPVAPGMDVPIQRFAGVFRVVGDGDRLAFAEPRAGDVVSRELSDVLILDPSTDSRRVPVRIANAARDYAVSLEGVRQLSEASGAFPVAFAPRSIAYRRLDALGWHAAPSPTFPCLPSPESAERCAAPEVARFVDGGVFDNRPLGLALGLAHAIEGSSSSTSGGDDVRPRRMLYLVDDDSRRLDSAALAAEVTTKETREPRAGVSAAVVTLTHAIETGWNAEVRGFVRQIEAEPGGRVSLGVNTRNPRLMAEHFAHFGAFLARSFREHDFYAGVYDGLRSAFRNLYCGTGPGAVNSSVGGTSCEEEWLRLVLDKNLIVLRPDARAVIDRFLFHESGGTGVAPARPVGMSFHGSALVALVDANVDGRRRGTRCTAHGSFFEGPLCAEQLLTVLAAWKDSLEKTKDWKLQLCNGDARYASDCDMVRDPQAVYHRVALEVLARLRLAEVQLDKLDGRGFPGPIGVPLYYERAYNEEFRSCFQVHSLPCVDINPTTSDVMGGWWYAGASHLLPVTAAATPSGRARWLEWRPTVYLARVPGASVLASAPIDLIVSRGAAHGGVGPSLTFMPTIPMVTSISASRLWEQRGLHSTDLTFAFLGGTIRVGFRDDPTGLGDFFSARNATLGLGDSNGLSARFLGVLASAIRRTIRN